MSDGLAIEVPRWSIAVRFQLEGAGLVRKSAGSGSFPDERLLGNASGL